MNLCASLMHAIGCEGWPVWLLLSSITGHILPMRLGLEAAFKILGSGIVQNLEYRIPNSINVNEVVKRTIGLKNNPSASRVESELSSFQFHVRGQWLQIFSRLFISYCPHPGCKDTSAIQKPIKPPLSSLPCQNVSSPLWGLFPESLCQRLRRITNQYFLASLW